MRQLIVLIAASFLLLRQANAHAAGPKQLYIVPDIGMISIQQINEAYDRLPEGNVKYRFVIDMASIKA